MILDDPILWYPRCMCQYPNGWLLLAVCNTIENEWKRRLNILIYIYIWAQVPSWLHFNCQKNFYCHHFHYYLAILDWTWPLLQPYYGVCVCVCVWYLCTRTFCVRVCINFNFIFIQHSPIAQCSPLFPLIIKRKNFFHLTRFYIIAHFENPAVFFPNYSWAAYLLMNNDSDSGSIHFWSLLVARYDPGWLQKRKKIDSERFSFIHWFSCQRVFFFHYII